MGTLNRVRLLGFAGGSFYSVLRRHRFPPDAYWSTIARLRYERTGNLSFLVWSKTFLSPQCVKPGRVLARKYSGHFHYPVVPLGLEGGNVA